ncbi:MAG TPA: NAD(P)/FAD-dependent oxidoreductase [Methylomusa anaerophila]|uniref:NADH:ubiquinone reductase (non-electrogenic) n=1 Tax=Methylomusa anaerophila TaxID=1930071 RepID=A0A348ALC7_9FIRM|nr:NAD(P)/FAD-dependent oxidoreductase [Methylomusa anaerophila]BBB91875.1 NADH dehydrogenase-like protein YjlD [Methylomusa anaerophila]HML88394.1 NAD(P)/FAD-dependent oxidoreductase [Methylomusa anaerophila]
MMQTLPHVVIVGAGFGGLWAARELAGAPVSVTLIDRNNYHLFQPLLYQVATAELAPEDIVYPVRSIFRHQKNLQFRMAEVEGADFNAKLLHTSIGNIGYDYLILAVGGINNYFGIRSVAENGLGLKNVNDAMAIRNQILKSVEMAMQETDAKVRQALMTFVVVGGGPTGVESAGALSELLHLVLPKDYLGFDFSQTRIILLQSSNRLLAEMPEPLSKETVAVLTRKKIEVRLGNPVIDFDGTTVTLKDGQTISAHTLIWAAGIQAASLAGKLGVRQARLGRIVVDPTLQVPDHPEVFVVGDVAYLEDNGQPLPMIAPVATQQAKTAVANIRRLLAGKPPENFTYRNPGVLATIGRNSAVAYFGRWQFHGFIAWVMWLVIHILRLIGFRNRLTVLSNWAWDYFFYERAVRFILHGPCDESDKLLICSLPDDTK